MIPSPASDSASQSAAPEFLIRTGPEDVAESGRVLDRLAIADAIHLYASAIDTLGNTPVGPGDSDDGLADATATLAFCLHASAQLRLFLSGEGGPSQALGNGGPGGAAAAIRAYFRAYGYVGTQHCVSNIRIAFTGADTAVSTSQIPCYHWLSDGRMLLAPVRYRDDFIRTDGIWQIARRDILATRFWVVTGYAADPFDPALQQP